MNSGIYCIFNAKDKKYYVGQSTELSVRLSSHKTKLNLGKHPNKQLQKDFNLKRNFFDIFVLETIPSDTDNLINVLNEREIFWIKTLESHSFGYNKNQGGRNVFGRWAKNFLWKNMETGVEVEASCSQMAATENCSESAFRAIIKNKNKFCFSWTLKRNFKETLTLWKRTRGRRVCLKNTITNEVLLNISPSSFAKKIGALRSDVYFLVNGKTLSLRGWRVINSEGEFLKRDRKLSKYILTIRNSTTGEMIKDINLSNFCRLKGVKYSSLISAIRKKSQKFLNWEIISLFKLKSNYDA